jgi:hypothetical protein
VLAAVPVAAGADVSTICSTFVSVSWSLDGGSATSGSMRFGISAEGSSSIASAGSSTVGSISVATGSAMGVGSTTSEAICAGGSFGFGAGFGAVDCRNMLAQVFAAGGTELGLGTSAVEAAVDGLAGVSVVSVSPQPSVAGVSAQAVVSSVGTESC